MRGALRDRDVLQKGALFSNIHNYNTHSTKNNTFLYEHGNIIQAAKAITYRHLILCTNAMTCCTSLVAPYVMYLRHDMLY